MSRASSSRFLNKEPKTYCGFFKNSLFTHDSGTPPAAFQDLEHLVAALLCVNATYLPVSSRRSANQARDVLGHVFGHQARPDGTESTPVEPEERPSSEPHVRASCIPHPSPEASSLDLPTSHRLLPLLSFHFAVSTPDTRAEPGRPPLVSARRLMSSCPRAWGLRFHPVSAALGGPRGGA